MHVPKVIPISPEQKLAEEKEGIWNVGTRNSVMSALLKLKKRALANIQNLSIETKADESKSDLSGPRIPDIKMQAWCESQLKILLDNIEESDSQKQQIAKFIDKLKASPLGDFDEATFTHGDDTKEIIRFTLLETLGLVAYATLDSQVYQKGAEAESNRRHRVKTLARELIKLSREPRCNEGMRGSIVATLNKVHPDVNLIEDVTLTRDGFISEFYQRKLIGTKQRAPKSYFSIIKTWLLASHNALSKPLIGKNQELESKENADVFIQEHQKECVDETRKFFQRFGITAQEDACLKEAAIEAHLTSECIAPPLDTTAILQNLKNIFIVKEKYDGYPSLSLFVRDMVVKMDALEEFSNSPLKLYPSIRTAAYFAKSLPSFLQEDATYGELYRLGQNIHETLSQCSGFKDQKQIEKALQGIKRDNQKFLDLYRAYNHEEHHEYIASFLTIYNELSNTAARREALTNLLKCEIKPLDDACIKHLFKVQTDTNEINLDGGTITRMVLQAYLLPPAKWSPIYKSKLTLLKELLDRSEAEEKDVDNIELRRQRIQLAAINKGTYQAHRAELAYLLAISHDDEAPINLNPAFIMPPLWQDGFQLRLFLQRSPSHTIVSCIQCLPETIAKELLASLIVYLRIKKLRQARHEITVRNKVIITEIIKHHIGLVAKLNPDELSILLYADKKLLTFCKVNQINDSQIRKTLSQNLILAYQQLGDKGTLCTALRGHGKTIFSYAARNGHTEIVRTMIDAYMSLEEGSDLLVNDLKSWDHDVFWQQANHDNTQAVQLLIKTYQSLNGDNTLLIEALKAGKDKTLRLAARAGDNTETINTLIKAYQSLGHDNAFLIKVLKAKGHAVFCKAAQYGHTNVVNTLIKTYQLLNGDNTLLIEALSARDHIALRLAVQHGHTETVLLLIEIYKSFKDGNALLIEALKANGHEALRYAAQQGHTETVRVLMDVYQSLGDGNALLIEGLETMQHDALRQAARTGHIDTARVLIGAYQAINDESLLLDAIRRPFCNAALYGRTETVDALIKTYQSPNGDNTLLIKALKAREHETLCTAAKYGHTKTVNVLIKGYQSLGDGNALLVEALEARDHNVFWEAARSGCKQTVSRLIEIYQSLGRGNALLIEALKAEKHRAFRGAAQHDHIVRFLIEIYQSLNGDNTLLIEALKAWHHSIFWQAVYGNYTKTINELIHTYKSLEDGMALLKDILKTNNHSALHNAAITGRTQTVSVLMDGYKSLEDGNALLLEALKAENHDVFYKAAYRGRIETVELLIETYQSLNDDDADSLPLFLGKDLFFYLYEKKCSPIVNVINDFLENEDNLPIFKERYFKHIVGDGSWYFNSALAEMLRGDQCTMEDVKEYITNKSSMKTKDASWQAIWDCLVNRYIAKENQHKNETTIPRECLQYFLKNWKPSLWSRINPPAEIIALRGLAKSAKKDIEATEVVRAFSHNQPCTFFEKDNHQSKKEDKKDATVSKQAGEAITKLKQYFKYRAFKKI